MKQDNDNISWSKSFKKAYRDEWLSITTDKAVVSTFISMSLLILVIYSMIYNKEVVYEVPVAAIDQDFSKSSRDFINMVDASPQVKTITKYADLASAKKALYAGDIEGIFIVPSRFGKDIRTNRQPTVSIYADAANMLLYRAVYGSAITAQAYYNGGIKVKKAIASGTGLTAISPLNINTTNLFNPSGGYGTYLIPTVAVLILQLVILLSIGILGGTGNELRAHDEKEAIVGARKLMPRLLGRASLYLSIFIVVIPIQFGLVFYFFSFPLRTTLAAIYLFSLPYILALVFMGIFISYFFQKREDAILFLSILVLPALMMSGLSYPTEGLNPLAQYAGELIPSTAGARGMIKLTQLGANFNEVYQEWAKLWGLALFYFLLAAIFQKFRKSSRSTKRQVQ
ncbi:ABC transporter permease [Maribacter sp. MMG018]|uniref:ABC transporter permease n=1 Tax=Maribacter sp. MMG018 TaxID=2822688 RepID=UPI001B382B9C|nr:ABC transporter permease [Maribacter sp. MMG018]MBQ4914194.1 ABC transporter permease [Maribacter sp. MMG018]